VIRDDGQFVLAGTGGSPCDPACINFGQRRLAVISLLSLAWLRGYVISRSSRVTRLSPAPSRLVSAVSVRPDTKNNSKRRLFYRAVDVDGPYDSNSTSHFSRDLPLLPYARRSTRQCRCGSVSSGEAVARRRIPLIGPPSTDMEGALCHPCTLQAWPLLSEVQPPRCLSHQCVAVPATSLTHDAFPASTMDVTCHFCSGSC
jgi:hypothetical protein